VPSNDNEPLQGRVLLVDDDPAIRRAFTRILESAGLRVETAENGVSAVAKLSNSYDLVVSDIAMPGLDGVALLKRIRQFDLDVPVLLMTGQPQVESAMQAVELGAFKYLAKPVTLSSFVDAVREGLRLHQMAKLKREAVGLLGSLKMQIGDRAGLEARFNLALDALWMAYQPIVSWKQKSVVAYECLLRSDEPTLPSPMAILDAAERLGALTALGRRIRSRCALAATDSTVPCLFVNLHPADLLDEELFSSDAPLSHVASHVVLEMTERASLDDVKDVAGRTARLRELGFRVAVDDLGAGYAGLSSFAQLKPEFVKLDMSLVRGVHQDPTKRKLIAAMAALCRDLSFQVIAEGVETAEERDVLIECGCDLLQGYLFGRPARSPEQVRW
jgi:EAL domain-containing protein (putative c-di-GMP-specific phosphodiesterase class I)/ActR/RegA family two-component response regulator